MGVGRRPHRRAGAGRTRVSRSKQPSAYVPTSAQNAKSPCAAGTGRARADEFRPIPGGTSGSSRARRVGVPSSTSCITKTLRSLRVDDKHGSLRRRSYLPPDTVLYLISKKVFGGRRRAADQATESR